MKFLFDLGGVFFDWDPNYFFKVKRFVFELNDSFFINYFICANIIFGFNKFFRLKKRDYKSKSIKNF